MSALVTTHKLKVQIILVYVTLLPQISVWSGSRTVYTSYLFGLPDTAKNDIAVTVDSSQPLTLYLQDNSPSYSVSLKNVMGLLCMNNYTVDIQVGPPAAVCRYHGPHALVMNYI